MASTDELERFGRYVLLHRIAMGGMAEIFLALPSGKKDEKDLLVIKRIREDLCTDETFTEMFIDEARVVSRLNHPNIIKMHEFGEVEGVYFIALEHVWGESLRTLTLLCTKAQMRFPMGAALYIGIETAKALDYAHHNRDSSGEISPVIHRDVTLGNVVISYDGDIKVLDFGIAKAKGRMSQTRAGQVKGTLAYLAPEQLAGGEMGPPTDIYQLGVLMYQTLVGRLPVQAESEGAMMGAIVAGNIVKPSDAVAGFPPKIEQVLLKAMARKPDQRFASAADFAGALSELLRGTSYEGGRERVAHMVTNITGDRKHRQMGMIKELLHGAAFDDESTDLFRWAAVDDAPQTLNVELSSVLDQGELDDFEDAPTIVMPSSEMESGNLQEQPAPMRMADADYHPLQRPEPTMPAIPAAAVAPGQPFLLDEEEYDDSPPTLTADPVVPPEAIRPEKRTAPVQLDPVELDPADLIPAMMPTPLPGSAADEYQGSADEAHFASAVETGIDVPSSGRPRAPVAEDVFANSNMAADDFDAILGIRDQQPQPPDDDPIAFPAAGNLRPALRSTQPNLERPMPLIKETPAAPEVRLSASDLFADLSSQERDPDSIGQRPLWDPAAAASGADIHSQTTSPDRGGLSMDEIPSALKPRPRSGSSRWALLLGAPILGVVGGFVLLAFVFAPDLGRRLFGLDRNKPVAADAGTPGPGVVTPATDASASKPDRAGPAVKPARDAAVPRDAAPAAPPARDAAVAARPDSSHAPILRPGFLTITSQAPILVDIDGKPVGQTPLYNIELPQGEHTVDMWRNPVKAKRMKVTIHPGETTTLAE